MWKKCLIGEYKLKQAGAENDAQEEKYINSEIRF